MTISTLLNTKLTIKPDKENMKIWLHSLTKTTQK